MTQSCPVLTPEQRHQLEIIEGVNQAMMAAISEAIATAHETVSDASKAAGFADPAPPLDYFVAVAQQKLFLRLCGADPETMQGGKREIAERIIENFGNIAAHYWRDDQTPAPAAAGE